MIDKKADVLPCIVTSFAAGIIWAKTGFMPNEAVCLGLTVFFAVASLFFFLLGHRRFTWSGLFLFFFALGTLHVRPFLVPPTDASHIANQVRAKKQYAVSGVLTKAPVFTGTDTHLAMEIESLHTPDNDIPSFGLIQLSLAGKPPPDLIPGDRFRAKAILRPIRAFGNPGGFDYREFLGWEGIWVGGWINNASHLVKLRSLDQPNGLARLRYLPEQARYAIICFLDQTAPDRYRGLYKAILVGDQSEVPADILENFKQTGCMHILAISGAQMGLLAFLIIGGINWALKRSTWIILRLPTLKIACLLAIFPVTCYAFIAGMNTPVVRALLMTLVFIVAILFDCQWRMVTNIFIAAFLILLVNPTSLYSASFQLSFAAVIAIAAISPSVVRHLWPDQQRNNLFRPKAWLLTSLAISCAAAIGTGPLAVYYFNQVSIISPFATLLVEPLFSYWSLVIGIGASLMIPISSQIAGLLFNTGAWGLMVSDKITLNLAALPFASISLPTPSIPEVIAWYAFFTGVLFYRRHFFVKPVTLASLSLMVAMPLSTQISRHFKDAISVTFLDVGQGSAAVLELPYGHVALIDGGGYKSDRFNVGERVLAPFLWDRGIGHIDDIIVTHAHGDHFNGLPYIMTRFSPKRLWINGLSSLDSEYEALLDQAAKLHIEVLTPKAEAPIIQINDMLLRSVGAYTQLPAPDIPSTTRSSGTKTNKDSLVLRLDCGDVSFLFPGDISGEREKELMEQNMPIGTHVLLAPHHGAWQNGTEDFLAKVQPKYLIISAGRENRFGFPDKELLAVAKRHGITTLTTFEDGAVTFFIRGAVMSMGTFRGTTPPALFDLDGS